MKKILLISLAFFFTACSDSDKIYYEVKGDEVLYHSYFRKGQELYQEAYETTVPVLGADAKTFKSLSKWYGVDANNVYHEAKRLRRRDAATFKVLNKTVTADKYGAYQLNKLIKHSDGLSFKFVTITNKHGHTSETRYAIDKKRVYFLEGNFYVNAKNADPETLLLFYNSDDYAKDKSQVYYRGHRLDNVNPNTFELIKSDYAKDDKFIYFKSKKLEQADYASFRMITEPKLDKYNAEDVNNYYRYARKSEFPKKIIIVKK